MVNDPQAEAVGAFVDVTRDNGEVYRSVATPVRFHDGEDARPRGDTPAFGQHSVEILKEHGYSAEEIDLMLEHKVIVE